jgi:hypothetical protein
MTYQIQAKLGRTTIISNRKFKTKLSARAFIKKTKREQRLRDLDLRKSDRPKGLTNVKVIKVTKLKKVKKRR